MCQAFNAYALPPHIPGEMIPGCSQQAMSRPGCTCMAAGLLTLLHGAAGLFTLLHRAADGPAFQSRMNLAAACRYFTDRLIKACAGLPKLCQFFHIPFQSGDNDILREMK